MAKSFYGFNNIQGYSPVIDFKSVRTEIDTELDRISEEREAKKKTIEDNTKAAMEALSKDEGMGQYEQLNNHVIGLTDQIKDNILIQNELMMSGRVRPSDYNKFVETSKASIDNIHTFANKLQERAANLQADDVSEISIFLDSEFVNNEYLKNNSFFQNARGEIYMAGIDEEGNIKFDENGNILNKMSPASMTAVANMPIIKETDFEAELDALWSNYGDITTNMTGEVIQTKVSAAIDEAHRKFGAMDDVEQLKFLAQETSNSKFELTRDREQAREANDKYMEVLGQINDIRDRIKDGDLSDEEAQSLTSQIGGLQSRLDSMKLYGYVNKTGDSGVIETELHPVHQLLMNDVATSMINARIPEKILETPVNTALLQSKEEDQTHAYLAGRVKHAIDLMTKGDETSYKEGLSIYTSILNGYGATRFMTNTKGEGYLYFMPTGATVQNTLDFNVTDLAGAQAMYGATLDLLGVYDYSIKAPRTSFNVQSSMGNYGEIQMDAKTIDDKFTAFRGGGGFNTSSDDSDPITSEDAEQASRSWTEMFK